MDRGRKPPRNAGRRNRNEGVALLFLHCPAAPGGFDDRADWKFLPQSDLDFAWLDTGSHPRLSGGERLSRRTTRGAIGQPTMKFAVIQFPGSNCDQDCVAAINLIDGLEAAYVWHKET